jgi:hypothetical protein
MIENLYHPEAIKARRNKKAHEIWAFRVQQLSLN